MSFKEVRSDEDLKIARLRAFNEGIWFGFCGFFLAVQSVTGKQIITI